jgi:hypothetical protein
MLLNRYVAASASDNGWGLAVSVLETGSSAGVVCGTDVNGLVVSG